MPGLQVDDTATHSVGAYGPALARDLTRISLHHRINRHSAYEWARNLRFLVFDDRSHVESNLNEDSNECLRHCSVERDADELDENEDVQRATANSFEE